ncbi:unnamed protein product [Trichogramma brassicae]|uniref:Uncharacterized protein n=1 Tax=Trichogramma brassicae TaxID=86971 RepID=A0A6H5IUP9_9HYME|nr:unnamed protein product [Trichogramma brassicae]
MSALTSDSGIASEYLVRLHCNVKRYLFPEIVIGKGPTTSISTTSKAVVGVVVIFIGNLVLTRSTPPSSDASGWPLSTSLASCSLPFSPSIPPFKRSRSSPEVNARSLRQRRGGVNAQHVAPLNQHMSADKRVTQKKPVMPTTVKASKIKKINSKPKAPVPPKSNKVNIQASVPLPISSLSSPLQVPCSFRAAPATTTGTSTTSTYSTAKLTTTTTTTDVIPSTSSFVVPTSTPAPQITKQNVLTVDSAQWLPLIDLFDQRLESKFMPFVLTPETFGEALRSLLNDPANHRALTCADNGAAGLDTAVRALTGFIVDAADAVAPLRPCAPSSSHRPWVDRGIRMLMDRRDRAYRRFRRNQRQEDLLRYRLLRTEVSNKLDTAKNAYYASRIASSASPAHMWRTLRSIGLTNPTLPSPFNYFTPDDLARHFSLISSASRPISPPMVMQVCCARLQTSHPCVFTESHLDTPNRARYQDEYIKEPRFDSISSTLINLASPSILTLLTEIFIMLQSPCRHSPTHGKLHQSYRLPKLKILHQRTILDRYYYYVNHLNCLSALYTRSWSSTYKHTTSSALTSTDLGTIYIFS